MSIDHERIWLQSAADVGTDGRMWCQDKVWPESVEDHEPTEYVRADLLAATQEENRRLRSALDIADRLIERGYGLDVPKEWNKAYRSIAVRP